MNFCSICSTGDKAFETIAGQCERSRKKEDRGNARALASCRVTFSELKVCTTLKIYFPHISESCYLLLRCFTEVTVMLTKALKSWKCQIFDRMTC